MRIVLCCATDRGYHFLERLHKLVPTCDLVVLSFKETSWEPAFLDRIRTLTTSFSGQFFEARTLTRPEFQSFWESTAVDLLLSVSWRYMIPPSIYKRARLGSFVLHDSLLPQYRGFSPTVWAMINGEKQTGVTLFHMAEAVDAGDIVDQQPVQIGDDETIAVVLDRVTETYLTILDRNINSLLSGTAKRTPQDHALATYTCKRHPSDNEIDWTRPAREIHNLIRAVSDPYSGAFTYHEGRLLRIWSSSCIRTSRQYVGAVPGRVVEVQPGKGTIVLTGQGELLVEEIQYEHGAHTRADIALSQVGQSLLTILGDSRALLLILAATAHNRHELGGHVLCVSSHLLHRLTGSYWHKN
jgi:methionyl-tRNA formyltransferase